VPAPCATCFKERREGNDNSVPIVFFPGRVSDHGYVTVKCSKGHESITLYDERRHDLLFRSACHTLIEGLDREAVSSFAAAPERAYEFFVRVVARHNNLTSSALEKTWKLMSKQSERQLGAFLIFYALATGTNYPLNQKMVEFRNKVIHQGYIPAEKEAHAYGDYVFNEMIALMKILTEHCPHALEAEVTHEKEEMAKSAPPHLPRLGFKAMLVNVNPSTNVAYDITRFDDFLDGVRRGVEARKRGEVI
jgi:hypothetical protein